MRYELRCHPDTPATGIDGVSVWVWPIQGNDNERDFQFYVRHSGTLLIPAGRDPNRADNLWKTTCFEAFLMREGSDRYVEFNLSPSFEWAAYTFDGYREGGRNLAPPFDPEISIEPTPGHFVLQADLDLTDVLLGTVRMNLTAVIEETDGTKSYWALAHAPGPPDFHNPDCFIARLPAPERP